jgi:hypothetical protein
LRTRRACARGDWTALRAGIDHWYGHAMDRSTNIVAGPICPSHPRCTAPLIISRAADGQLKGILPIRTA